MNKVIELERKLNLDKSKWKLTKIGTLADEISSRVDNPATSEYDRFVGLDDFISGDIKISKWSTTENLTSSAKAFKKGDILFARRNAYLRRASLVDFDGCCSGDAFVIREKQDKVVPGFLAFLFNTDNLWDYANSNAAGTMSKRVKWDNLAEYELLLPPKAVQVELSKLLWTTNDLIEKEKKLYTEFILFRDVNRETLYTEGVLRQSKSSCSDSNIERSKYFRKDWDRIKFSEIAEITSGQVDPRNIEYANLVQIGSERIGSNNGRILELKTAKELNIESGNYLFTEDHIIYSKIRPYLKKVANPGFVGLCSADIYPIKPTSNRMLKDFLFYFMLTEKFTNEISKFQNRTGMPKVNRDELSSIYIPLPNLEEQRKIIGRLNLIDTNILEIEKKIYATRALQKNLINQIF